jgi:hypothetical protein
MSDRDESALGKADGFLKKLLERVGSSVDRKLSNEGEPLPSSVVDAVAAAIETAIESHVRADGRGARRLAPDRFTVMLTYEQDARLSDARRAALAKELAASAYEYIANHRYVTYGAVRVDVSTSVFSTKTEVRAEFSAAPGTTADGAVQEVQPVAAGNIVAPESADSDYQFVGLAGKHVVRVRITPGGEPVTVGRSAGNRLFVDDGSVSKFHATVQMTRDGRLVVTDLDSTNGTFVNDDAVRISGPRAIEPGDTVTFGDIAFRLEKV